MAYNALNNLIDAYIYANGVQAITGQILNGVLKQMVSQLGSGYHLMGVAGPETVPASNDFAMAYFAATAGEYADFGGITLAAGEVAVLLTSGNGSWSKQTIYTVPTGTADLENTAGFITNAVTDLVNYYTKEETDTTLADYPTLEALATALANYYTKQEVDGTLADYATKDGVDETLEDYYTKDEVDAALGDRYTKDETDTKLEDYYKKAETYDKDEVDSLIAALSRQEYIVAWDGLAAPDVSAIPAGVTVTYNATPYTGTLDASASTVNKIYMVWNGTAYDMYGTSQDGGYSWVPMGTTTVDLSQYATKAEVSQLEAEISENIKLGAWEIGSIQPGSTSVPDYASTTRLRMSGQKSIAKGGNYTITCASGYLFLIYVSGKISTANWTNNRTVSMDAGDIYRIAIKTDPETDFAGYTQAQVDALIAASKIRMTDGWMVQDMARRVEDLENEVGGMEVVESIGADLKLADGDGDTILELNGGNIKTKNFDSKGQPFVESTPADFAISDDNGKTILKLKAGGIRTKNFDSDKLPNIEDSLADYEIADANNDVLMRIRRGHIVTANFDSEKAEVNQMVGKKIVWYGTSIPAAGYPQICGQYLNATVHNEAVGGSMCRMGMPYATPDNPLGDVYGIAGLAFQVVCTSLSMKQEEKHDIFVNWTTARRQANLIAQGYTAEQVANVRGWGELLTGGPADIMDSSQDNYRKMSYGLSYNSSTDIEPGLGFIPGKVDKYLNSQDFPDLWVFDHGHNDDKDNPASEIETIPTPFDDRHYFIGSVNFLINHILQYNPRARFLIIGHYDRDTTSVYHHINVTDAQIKLAAFWNAPIYKTWEYSFVTRSRVITTNAYWDENGVWHDSGFDGTNGYAGVHYDGVPENIRQVDGVWVHDMSLLWVHMLDGLHPAQEEYKDFLGHSMAKYISSLIVNF